MEKQNVVLLGGGITSTVELPLYVAKHYPPGTVRFLMAGLRNEHPDVWRLVGWVQDRTGIEVEIVSYSATDKGSWKRVYSVDEMPDIWDIFRKQRMLGSNLYDTCSKFGKREVIYKYLKKTVPKGSRIFLGITYDERKRMLAVTQIYGKMGYIAKAPLVRVRPEGTKEERCMRILGWVPEMYTLGFKHHNCHGMCVKAGKYQYRMLAEHYPEVYRYHEEQELAFRRDIKGDRALIRTQRDKQVTWNTMQEFRLSEDLFRVEEDRDFGCNSCDAIGS